MHDSRTREGYGPHILGARKAMLPMMDCFATQRTLPVHRQACRYLMDVDTLYPACRGMIADEGCRAMTVNTCFDHPVRIPDLVAAMELVLDKKAIMAEEERGTCYVVGNSPFKAHWQTAELGPWPGADCWRRIILKYYGRPGLPPMAS